MHPIENFNQMDTSLYVMYYSRTKRMEIIILSLRWTAVQILFYVGWRVLNKLSPPVPNIYALMQKSTCI